MADIKITDLANLAAPDGADLVEAVDVSDTSSAATGTNKKLTLTNFQVWLGGFSYTPSAHAASHEGGADAISPAGIGAEPAFSKNTAFNKNFGALVDTVCQGNDARLSDARAPTTHANTHATGQADAIAPADIGAEPAISPKNTAFNKNYGSGADTVCQGNDARLSDARTPTSHASSHDHGGADALAIFGTAAQGVVPASGGGTTNFLRADGNWAAPAGGGGTGRRRGRRAARGSRPAGAARPPP